MAMTFTYDDGIDPVGRAANVCKVIADWTSDGSGNASGTTRKVVGELIKGVTDPGSPAPTDNYDIVVTDEEGVNVLAACDDDLIDRDTTTTEEVYFLLKDHAGSPLAQSLRPAVCDKLTITVSNAGNATKGQLILYVNPRM